MRKIVSILLYFSCAISAYPQSIVDFRSRYILEEVEKFNGGRVPILNEMKIDSLSRNDFRIYAIENHPVTIKYLYVGRVNTCRAGGCSISRNSNIGFEYFDYFVLFDERFHIKLVKVFNYQATHGYEITIKGWLKQFIGYDGSDELRVGKEIDAISGATISTNAITSDIQSKVSVLKEMVNSLSAQLISE